MRRLLIAAILLLASSLLVFGCRDKEPEPVPTTALLSEEAVYTSMMMELDSQRPDRKPDYCGVLKSINNKEITLALVEAPVRPKLTEEERAKLKAEGKSENPKPTLKMTGETQKLTVTNTTRIVSFTRQEGRLSMRPLALTDLKAGNVLMAWVEGENLVYLQSFPSWEQEKK